MDGVTNSIDFPALFREYILNNVHHMLEQVQQSQVAVRNPDERDDLFQTLSFALDLPDALPAGLSLVKQLSPAMEQAGYREEWMPYLEKGMSRSRQMGDPLSEAELSFQLGILHQLLANFEQAQQRFIASLEQFRQRDCHRYQAQVYNRQAQILRAQQNPQRARQLINRALALLDADDSERALSYATLGGIAFDQGDYDRAIHDYKQAFTIRRQEGNLRQMAWNLTNLGAAHKRQGRFAEAISHYQEAIALLDDVFDPMLKGVATMNLGNVHLEQRQPSVALELYDQAKSLFKETQSDWYLAMLYHNGGSAYLALTQWSAAEDAYLTAIAIHRKLGNISAMANSMDDLASTYMKQDKFEQAAQFIERSLQELQTHTATVEQTKWQNSLQWRLDEIYTRSKSMSLS